MRRDSSFVLVCVRFFWLFDGELGRRSEEEEASEAGLRARSERVEVEECSSTGSRKSCSTRREFEEWNGLELGSRNLLRLLASWRPSCPKRRRVGVSFWSSSLVRFPSWRWSEFLLFFRETMVLGVGGGVTLMRRRKSRSGSEGGGRRSELVQWFLPSS